MAKYDDWINEKGELHPDKAIVLLGWARNGLSEKQISANMGIDYSTLKDWKKRFPAFSALLKNTKEVADMTIENALFKKAKNGDTTAMIFYLKNRRPDTWRDKPAVSVNDAMLAKAREILGDVKSGID